MILFVSDLWIFLLHLLCSSNIFSEVWVSLISWVKRCNFSGWSFLLKRLRSVTFKAVDRTFDPINYHVRNYYSLSQRSFNVFITTGVTLWHADELSQHITFVVFYTNCCSVISLVFFLLFNLFLIKNFERFYFGLSLIFEDYGNVFVRVVQRGFLSNIPFSKFTRALNAVRIFLIGATFAIRNFWIPLNC